MLRSARQVLSELNPLLIDGVVALHVLGLMGVQLASGRPLLPGQHPVTALAWILAILICAPILTHRKFPIASLAICLAAVLAYAPGRFAAYPGFAVFVLVFDITLHSRRQIAFAALIASAAAMAGAVATQPSSVASFGTWVGTELGVLVAWLAGENVRGRRAAWSALQDRAERLERDQAEQAQRAVAQERLRIARELHDVIAHSMSVIAVQSAVGHHVMDDQPQQARQALAAIEAISRSALTEMRRLLGVLRQEGEPQGSLSPAPGLADLAMLASQVQEAGLNVWMRVDGERFAVPAGVDLSAYRIVQEALTNVIKHAASADAHVSVSYRPGSLGLEITNDGAVAPAAAASSGHGLIGMRERVAVYGGEFTAGPRPEGGYRVHASFPIAGVTT